MTELFEKEPVEIIEEYISEPTPLDIAKAKGEQRRAMQAKIDSIEKDTIVTVEARLAKIEAVPIVKTALEPVIKEPTLSK